MTRNRSACAGEVRNLGIGRQLVEASLAQLIRLGIHRCNIFVFAHNTEGMKFWNRTGWGLRAEIRTMQIRLADGNNANRNRGC